jgi:hypothetical protein
MHQLLASPADQHQLNYWPPQQLSISFPSVSAAGLSCSPASVTGIHNNFLSGNILPFCIASAASLVAQHQLLASTTTLYQLPLCVSCWPLLQPNISYWPPQQHSISFPCVSAAGLSCSPTSVSGLHNNSLSDNIPPIA